MMHVTERLVLRDFVEGDWPAVLAYQRDPRYLRFYPWTGRTPEEVRAFVGMFIGQQRETPRTKYQLAITLKAGGRLIGNCGIRLDQAGAHEGDTGYELDPAYWGQGFATEAVRAIVGWGFSELHLRRVSAWCIAANLGSARVLDKLGMRCEARLRDREYFKGRWWDVLVYAVSEEQWQAHVGAAGLSGTLGIRT